MASIISDFEVFDHQAGCCKLWIKILLHQIHLISNGSRVLIACLPIRSPTNLPTSQSSVIMVMACLVCGFYFEENNIIVASCKCMYHLFCLAMYMESKPKKCAKLTYEKVFTNHWINNFRFK